MINPGCPLGTRLSQLVAQVNHALRSRIEVVLRPYGLTAIQYSILDLLAQQDGPSSADLSRHFLVTPQTMGEMIGTLESRHLVARRKDPHNRRVLRLGLTAEATAVLQRCGGEVDRIEEEVFGTLALEDLERLRIALAALAEAGSEHAA